MNLYVRENLAIMGRAYRCLQEKCASSRRLMRQEDGPGAFGASATIASEFAIATRDIIDFVARIDTDAKHQAA